LIFGFSIFFFLIGAVTVQTDGRQTDSGLQLNIEAVEFFERKGSKEFRVGCILPSVCCNVYIVIIQAEYSVEYQLGLEYSRGSEFIVLKEAGSFCLSLHLHNIFIVFCCAGVVGQGSAGHGATQISQVDRPALGHRPSRDRILPLLTERRGCQPCGSKEQRRAASAEREQQQQQRTSQDHVGDVDIRSATECPACGRQRHDIGEPLRGEEMHHVSSVLHRSAAAARVEHEPVSVSQGASSLEEGSTVTLYSEFCIMSSAVLVD